MLVVRTILGNAYVCQKPHKYRRPPCTGVNCTFLDYCSTHPLHHSVIGVNRDNGQRLMFREFIVYNSAQCYPLYLVTYNRVP